MRVCSSYTHVNNRNGHPTNLFIYLFIKTAHHKLARAWILQRAQLSRQLLFCFFCCCFVHTKQSGHQFGTTLLHYYSSSSSRKRRRRRRREYEALHAN